MKRIEIIEDDLAMQGALAELLRNSGYDPIIAKEFSAENILADSPDLLLLDINLPGGNGIELLKAVRAKSDLPVIMLTSSSLEIDEALSMSFGADDYVTKPYSPSILLLRLAAILRRTESTGKPILFRNLNIDLDRGVVEALSASQSEKSRLTLTKNEMIILRHLLENSGKIVTRADLMTDLWNNQEYINDNALTVNISRLRRKLARLGADGAIETRKNLGYILA